MRNREFSSSPKNSQPQLGPVQLPARLWSNASWYRTQQPRHTRFLPVEARDQTARNIMLQPRRNREKVSGKIRGGGGSNELSRENFCREWKLFSSLSLSLVLFPLPPSLSFSPLRLSTRSGARNKTCFLRGMGISSTNRDFDHGFFFILNGIVILFDLY